MSLVQTSECCRESAATIALRLAKRYTERAAYLNKLADDLTIYRTANGLAEEELWNLLQRESRNFG